MAVAFPVFATLLFMWHAHAQTHVSRLSDFVFDCASCLDASDYFKLGTAVGSTYHETIQKRMSIHIKPLETFLASAAGQAVYVEFLATHQRLVPKLVFELEGLAHGSGVSFQTMFAVSLKEELGYFAQPGPSGKRLDECSDYMLCTETRCVNGHNEDGPFTDHELFTAFVRLGRSNFTTLNYAGDLMGGMSALAFNVAGLAFSLNYVAPGHCTTDGLGRNFVSRLLLEAESWNEAVDIISQRHAAGHNYQLMDFVHRRIASFEVANNVYSSVSVREPFFHANQYQVLNVPGQIYGNSSIHRLARIRQIPQPKGRDDILKILGDQEDHSYPVFHDTHSHAHGDLSDWTLATAFFDLDMGTIALMDGNPADGAVRKTFHVLRPTMLEV